MDLVENVTSYTDGLVQRIGDTAALHLNIDTSMHVVYGDRYWPFHHVWHGSKQWPIAISLICYYVQQCYVACNCSFKPSLQWWPFRYSEYTITLLCPNFNGLLQILFRAWMNNINPLFHVDALSRPCSTLDSYSRNLCQWKMCLYGEIFVEIIMSYELMQSLVTMTSMATIIDCSVTHDRHPDSDQWGSFHDEFMI